MTATRPHDIWSPWMLRCVELARKAEGRTSPNPMVGAVVLDADGALLSEGWHEGPGQPHAEVAALGALGGRAPKATMVVNLEPCCHVGRTPPCTDAILKSGVSRVVVGMIDPNPLVAGQGVAILREAGIEVVLGVEEQACREFNHAFVSLMDAERA